MLSISQLDKKYSCYQWVPTEKGPVVSKYGHFKVDSENNLDSNHLKKVLKLFQPQKENNSKSLSISLNINNINLTSFETDFNVSDDLAIKWFKNNVLNKDFLKDNHLYFYPINSDSSKIFLVISIKINLKNNIELFAKELGYNLLHIAVDIFSAGISAKQILKIPKNENFLIWKVDKANKHYLTYYANEDLSSYLEIKIINGNISVIKSIGSEKKVLEIIKCIEGIIKQNDNGNCLENIFIYQTKNDFKQIKNILSLSSKINLLDVSSIFEKKISKYSAMQYIENGMALRGIDV